MLALMYDTGARVQEIIDLNPGSIRLNKPYTIKLVGKGNKARIVPLMDRRGSSLKKLHVKKCLIRTLCRDVPLVLQHSQRETDKGWHNPHPA